MESGHPFTAAYEAIVREHYENLAVFAYRILHDRDEAEDTVQTVFLRIWERRDQGVLREPLSYFYTAVRNQALMRLRRAHRWQRPSDERALDTIAVEAEVEEITDAEDLSEALDRAVRALPDRTRLVWSMSREQHMSYAVIAKTLGISVKTVESQMARALRILRVRLAPFLAAALTAVELGGR